MPTQTLHILKDISDPDMKFLSYAEWIAGDFIDFIKTSILPVFNDKYDLKLREVRVLVTIAQSRRPITASEIAEFLRQDPATVTRSTVILIGEGYVVPTENYSDGRSRILNLTNLGQESADYFQLLFKTAISKMKDSFYLNPLSETEQDSADHILDTIANRSHDLKQGGRKLERVLRNSNIS